MTINDWFLNHIGQISIISITLCISLSLLLLYFLGVIMVNKEKKREKQFDTAEDFGLSQEVLNRKPTPDEIKKVRLKNILQKIFYDNSIPIEKSDVVADALLSHGLIFSEETEKE